jgi:hypothetical protein
MRVGYSVVTSAQMLGFALINPGQTRADNVTGIQVQIVRELHKKGVLIPVAVPGKKMMYRKNPRWYAIPDNPGISPRTGQIEKQSHK